MGPEYVREVYETGVFVGLDKLGEDTRSGLLAKITALDAEVSAAGERIADRIAAEIVNPLRAQLKAANKRADETERLLRDYADDALGLQEVCTLDELVSRLSKDHFALRQARAERLAALPKQWRSSAHTLRSEVERGIFLRQTQQEKLARAEVLESHADVVERLLGSEGAT
jgi:hypothetical protein